MERFAPERIRNVVLLGHHGVGKTTVAEALLATAGAVARRGRVEDGTTVCDFTPEEHQRGMSLSLAVAPFVWRDHKINVLDCPGEPDMVGAVHAALAVADLAILVVSGVEGVEPQTESLWRLAGERGVPRIVFVNKLDRERSDFDRTLQQLQAAFGSGFAPLELPIGAEAELHGLVDVLRETADLYDHGAATHAAPVPDELAAREHEVHDQVVEEIVAGDDALLERFLSDDVPSVDELEHALAVEMQQQIEFPVLCGSAVLDVGIDRLADFIVEIGTPPSDRTTPVHAGDSVVEVVCDPDGAPLLRCFMTVSDPYVGHISLFKVLSGTVRPDDHLWNARAGVDERLHTMFTLRGKEQEPLTEVSAGDIFAVAKLAATATGDALTPRGKPVGLDPLPVPPPSLSMAIVARTQADDDKLGPALHRLQEEDPALGVRRDDETHQTLLEGTGEVHLRISIERLQRKFGVTVDTEDVRVAYRETVTDAAMGVEGKHKKQSGGHGQFGVCVINLLPAERGAGFEFVDKIVGGAIGRSYVPAVQRGIDEAMTAGGVHGHPVVDVRVELIDGKQHSVDSSEMAFRIAGRTALREAMAKASPVLLEPISRLEVTVPSALQGDVLGDLNARRGRVQQTEAGRLGEHIITALVPTAEVLRYAIDLRSLTGSRGHFTADHDHYDVLPTHLVDAVSRDARDLD
ncbi:MAG: elongation factor G [Acidimicrobiales bacterium]